jgi:hypothetical protein
VKLKFELVPEHPLRVGVTVMVAICGLIPLFVAVKLGIFPEPPDVSPIDELLLNQV